MSRVIRFKQHGDLSKTYKFLQRAKELIRLSAFDKYGRQGVEALSAATPVDTGKTAASWRYEIEHSDGAIRVVWINDNVVNDYVNIAIILQYGHGTRNGGYVQGRDYINPAIKPVMDQMADEMWKELIS